MIVLRHRERSQLLDQLAAEKLNMQFEQSWFYAGYLFGFTTNCQVFALRPPTSANLAADWQQKTTMASKPILKKHLPNSNGTEKAAKWTNIAAKKQSPPTYFHEKPQESPNIG